MNTLDTAAVVKAYYAAWASGRFDEARLRELVRTDLEFEGPMAGKRPGREPFVAALGNVSRSVVAFRPAETVIDGDSAAVTYECDFSEPKATVRFAELLRVADGTIRSVKIYFDPTPFRRSS